MFENIGRSLREAVEIVISKNEPNLIETPEKISEENLPEIIDDQVNNIKILDRQIQKALKNAGNAREAAEIAANMSAGWFHKKSAIEGLQSAVEEIGNATADNAESQRMLFDCLQKMAQVEKIILQIGCMSIAMNRSTIRELELKLKGASNEELSELAKKELQSVIKQIRQQQDILEKQARLENNVRTLHEESQAQKNRLDKKDNLDSTQSVNIAANKKRLDEKDKIDAEQSKRLEELSIMLNNKNLLDQEQEEAINKNAEALKVLFEYTKQKDILDKEQSAKIDLLTNENKEQNRKLSNIHASLIRKEQIDVEQSQRLEEIKKLLDSKGLLDQRQEESINKNTEAIKVLFEYTKQKDIFDKEQSEKIDFLSNKNEDQLEQIKIMQLSYKKLRTTAIVISVCTFVCSIVSIILKFIL